MGTSSANWWLENESQAFCVWEEEAWTLPVPGIYPSWGWIKGKVVRWLEVVTGYVLLNLEAACTFWILKHLLKPTKCLWLLQPSGLVTEFRVRLKALFGNKTKTNPASFLSLPSVYQGKATSLKLQMLFSSYRRTSLGESCAKRNVNL